MKNVHIIPTDKPSRLIKQTHGKLRLSEITFKGQIASGVTQNIYITSDEEIKFDEYYLGEDSNIYCLVSGVNYNGKKIILTTDQDLIEDGVQEIPEYFLIHYIVGNNPIEYVEIKEHLESIDTMKINYELIIPKEEPKKVLTEEDIFSQKDIDVVTDYINKEQQKHNLEPLEVPMPIYSSKCKDCDTGLSECQCTDATFDYDEEMTYEEDLVKKIRVVLSVGNEAQAVRLIEKYAQYRLEPFEELVNNWHQQQINYEVLAEQYIDDQHNNRKFTYKAMATRDCWKALLSLINK
jgi:hypothetical protein